MVGGGGRGRGQCGWHRRLARRWINGDGDDEIRVSGCSGGAAPTRLEGARGRRRGVGIASAVGCRRAGPEGGGLPEMGREEVGGGEKNPSRRRRHRTRGRLVGGSHAPPEPAVQQNSHHQPAPLHTQFHSSKTRGHKFKMLLRCQC
jgi:hypothetical protein